MFGIGMSEMLIILAVALLVFGPTKLPEIAKGIAKGLRELRRAGDDLKRSVDFDLDERPKQAPRPPTTQVSAPSTPAAIAGSELAMSDAVRNIEEANAQADVQDAAAHANGGEVWPKPADGLLSRGNTAMPTVEPDVVTAADEKPKAS